jgi:hypothetical protein
MSKKLTIIDGAGKSTSFSAGMFSSLSMKTNANGGVCVEKTGPLGINRETTCIAPTPAKSCGTVKVSSDCGE